MEVTKMMLANEIARVSSVRPEALKLFGNQKPDASHRTWLALFTKAPKPGLRVFDESGVTSVFKKQVPIEFCKRCNGHHSSKFCSRVPSCGNYGSNMHTQDTCIAATRCRNCGGPHRSDNRKCLARPTCHGAPTKEKLKVYRQAGDRESQAAVRARAAEEKASEILTYTPGWEYPRPSIDQYGRCQFSCKTRGMCSQRSLSNMWVGTLPHPAEGEDKSGHFTHVVSHWLPTISAPNYIEETENLAQDLCRILKEAIKAVDKRPSRGKGKSAPWWTLEFKVAHFNYKDADTSSERSENIKIFRATVASAKREYWKKLVESLTSSSDVFRLMRWASPKDSGIPPQLIHQGRITSDQEERAMILRDSLPARHQASDDLLPCTLLGSDHIQWIEEVTEIEDWKNKTFFDDIPPENFEECRYDITTESLNSVIQDGVIDLATKYGNDAKGPAFPFRPFTENGKQLWTNSAKLMDLKFV
ncbi:hypothetical protein EPUL_004307 [Erysiphe pulchra]|uniref:Uncharacterized protein n=1 Tax=Erysiphe pulchra TaxID=225359 RepID=A0A2S4PNI3_9PEZI|nr:hypothetical protein EPUL_004307 [Erysiphe pulchra]